MRQIISCTQIGNLPTNSRAHSLSFQCKFVYSIIHLNKQQKKVVKGKFTQAEEREEKTHAYGNFQTGGQCHKKKEKKVKRKKEKKEEEKNEWKKRDNEERKIAKSTHLTKENFETR